MIPTLAACDFLGPGPAPAEASRTLAAALAQGGGVHLRLPEPQRSGLTRALRAAEAFFDLPHTAKAEIAIDGSPRHRGWSRMHNERDWREQVHLGREGTAPGPGAEVWRSLEGPNPWPASLGPAFRDDLEAHLEACAALGQGLLRALAPAHGFDGEVMDASNAYLLMKLIAYHPQPDGAQPRRGVAAHVDFSLLTLLAQDPGGGLEIRNRAGCWLEVAPEEGSLFVNLGEVLEALTGGALKATPHRVTHRSTRRARISLPVFYNPPLGAWIHPKPWTVDAAEPGAPDHVHRVLMGGAASFRFGEAEWRRKGQNLWCAACCG